jgi:pimeloyl-ACP methyl ester carboxylesterase
MALSTRRRLAVELERGGDLLSRTGAMAGKIETSLAILNGVLGDYLARTGNGLATTSEVFASTASPAPLRLERDALRRTLGDARPRLVVLLHGLMCNESIWKMPDGSDYGRRLAADLGFTPVYVRYNTGLPIAENGEQVAALFSSLVAAYPGPVDEIVAIGHSMGGLVLRSACHVARLEGSAWLPPLRRAIYLGTPHLGSPLERIGRAVTRVLEAVPDPYTRLVAEIADLRSRGIKDLGDGLRDERHPIPLLPEITHYLVAAHLSTDPWMATLFGDSLVPVASATNGLVARVGAALPPDRVKVLPGSGHIGLAHDPQVYELVRSWCGESP